MDRIGLNGRFSGTLRPTGTQVVAFHLFDAIVRANRNVELTIFADPAFPGVAAWADVPRTQLVPVPFSAWPRSRSQLWEQFVLPAKARRHGCGLVHHPITTCPVLRSGVRHMVTVHDLNFYHHPEWMGAAFRAWLMGTAVPGIRKADHVVAISDYVLGDIRRTLSIPTGRSSRIYNGFSPSRLGRADASTRPAIFMLNAWQPHKNLARVLDAFAVLRRDHPQLELRLAGRPQANYQSQPDLRARLEQPGVTVLGYLSPEDLSREYASASVFCYPSLEEGFGLPVLEAMDAGLPVVTSNVSCLPETAGGAAILVDPLSVDDIVRGLREVLAMGGAERNDVIARGRERAACFSWDAAAAQYLELYERLLK